MTRPDLLLHVGMDKTGTTAIQHMLHRARAALLAEGLLVPETGMLPDRSHHPFAFAALGIAGHALSDTAPLFAALAAECARSPAPRVLLSSECLFKLPSRGPASPFWDHVARAFGRVQAIVYLRRQDAWVESRHRHSILSGRVFPLDRLAEPEYCDYRQHLDAWAARLGPGNIIVRPYEAAQFQGGDIATDMLATLGLPPGRIVLPADRRNQSLPAQALLFLASLPALDAGLRARLNAVLLARPRGQDPDPPFLSPTDARALLDRYDPVNAGIARTYMGRADGRLFTDPPPAPDPGWTPPRLMPAGAAALLADVAAADPGLAAALAPHLDHARRSGAESGHSPDSRPDRIL